MFPQRREGAKIQGKQFIASNTSFGINKKRIRAIRPDPRPRKEPRTRNANPQFFSV